MRSAGIQSDLDKALLTENGYSLFKINNAVKIALKPA
jgi:hypothetical protein